MKFGFISDIHGNRVALQVVLDHMEPVDKLVCLGDIVGYGPQPSECVDIIRDVADVVIFGNHEYFLNKPELCGSNRGAFLGICHALSELTPEQIEWTQNLPYRSSIGNGTLKIAHGNPDPQAPFLHIQKHNVNKLIPVLQKMDATALAIGHTHEQFSIDLRDEYPETGIVFNPGSVGQPRDGDPRASYALFNTKTKEVKQYRVDYDIERVQEQIKTAGLPIESATRLEQKFTNQELTIHTTTTES